MTVIGICTTYIGEEFPGLRGRPVRVFAVLLGEQRPGIEEREIGSFVLDDKALARHGGLTRWDRVAVTFLNPDGSPDSVHWSTRAVDLACFQDLSP